MAQLVTLTTERLVLRPWRDSDREPFASMNADPVVMEHFPSTLTREQSDGLVDRIKQRMTDQGWGLWAVEVPGEAEFVGFVGLNPGDDALGRPCVEVGWRLDASHWGHGYAPEGARAAVAYAFDRAGLDEVVSFTTPNNLRSQRVMQKVGLTLVGEFDHGGLAEGHPLRRHVLYRAVRDRWPVPLATGNEADDRAGATRTGGAVDPSTKSQSGE
jgi:RimJ/RimL family protein N-acetyltransferase